MSRESVVCNFLPVSGKTIFSRSLSRQLTVVASILAIIVYVPTIVLAQTSNVAGDLGSASHGDRSRVENKSARAIREHSTRAEAWVRLGTIRIQQKNYAEGIRCLKTALALDPRSDSAHTRMGEAYVLIGKRAEARVQFYAALRINRTDRNARFGLAALESANGNFSASLEVARPILDTFQHSPGGLVVLAIDYDALGRTDSLLSLVIEWKQLAQVPADATEAFATVLIKNGFNQQALEILQAAEEEGQVSYGLAIALAKLYLSRGELDKALVNYEGALTLQPQCLECLLHIANIAEQQKDPERALAYLIKARHIEPENPQVLFEFGKSCLELDLADDGIAALQKAANLRPANDSYTYVLASAHVAKKDYEAALTLFRILLKKNPDDPVVNYAIGSVLFLQVRLDEASGFLQRSIDLRPDQSAPYYYLGLIAEGKGQTEQAITTLQDLVHRFTGYAPAYEALGAIFLRQRRFVEAQQSLERAILLDPSSAKSHYQLGVLFGRLGKSQEADQQFELVNELNAQEARRSGMKLHLINPQ